MNWDRFWEGVFAFMCFVALLVFIVVMMYLQRANR